MEWTDEKVFRLIKLYELNPCLYDATRIGYHNRKKKKLAVDDIADQLQTTDGEVSKKLKHLRSHFGDELKRVKSAKSEEQGGADGRYATKWKYFNALSFLSSHVNVNRNTSLNNSYLVKATDRTSSAAAREQSSGGVNPDDAFHRTVFTRTSTQSRDSSSYMSTPCYNMDRVTLNMGSTSPFATRPSNDLKRKKCLEDVALSAYDKSLNEPVRQFANARPDFIRVQQQQQQAARSVPEHTNAEDDDRAFAVLVELELRKFTNMSIKRTVKKTIIDALFDAQTNEAETAERKREQEMQYYYRRDSSYNFVQPTALRVIVPPPPPPPPPPPTADDKRSQSTGDVV